MREERIKALVLAALIAAEIIPLEGALIERASKALNRAAATLAKEMNEDAPPREMVMPPQSLEPAFGQRPPIGPKSAAQRRKEALEKTKLEPPYSPDDAS
jgi:hypothetical protein